MQTTACDARTTSSPPLGSSRILPTRVLPHTETRTRGAGERISLTLRWSYQVWHVGPQHIMSWTRAEPAAARLQVTAGWLQVCGAAERRRFLGDNIHEMKISSLAPFEIFVLSVITGIWVRRIFWTRAWEILTEIYFLISFNNPHVGSLYCFLNFTDKILVATKDGVCL